MKKFFRSLVERLGNFLEGREQPGFRVPQEPIEEEPTDEIFLQLEQAKHEKKAVHVIYGHQSFTGEIVRLDANQVVLKNFSRSMTTIIHLDEIKRVRFVPEAVKISQTTKV